MKPYSRYQKAAFLSLGVFVLFLVLFFAAGALVRHGVMPAVEFSQAVQGIMAFLFFLPLLAALFFLGQHLKTKAGNAQTVYKILTFVSIALFVFGLVQMLLSIVGVY